MACLGEPSRFRLARELLEGPRCVTDLAARVGLSQSCTTRHLQVLERRAVVRGARDGKRMLYRLRDDDPALRGVLDWALGQGAPPAPGPRPRSSRAVRAPGEVAGRAPGPPPTAPGEPPRAEPGPAAGPDPVPSPTGDPAPRVPRPEWTPRPAGRGRDAEIEDFLL